MDVFLEVVGGDRLGDVRGCGGEDRMTQPGHPAKDGGNLCPELAVLSGYSRACTPPAHSHPPAKQPSPSAAPGNDCRLSLVAIPPPSLSFPPAAHKILRFAPGPSHGTDCHENHSPSPRQQPLRLRRRPHHHEEILRQKAALPVRPRRTTTAAAVAVAAAAAARPGLCHSPTRRPRCATS